MEIPNESKLIPGLPVCNWVYFATPAKESWTVTRDFVDVAKIIFCHIYNKSGLLMPNVQHLQRGEQILLVHGGHGQPYRALFCCKIEAAAKPVQASHQSFDVLSYADESLYERLTSSGYDPDPVLKKFTGISIAAPQDLRHITRSIPKPKGNNTLRRWDEVFPQ
jgi:hypothetical protein